MTARKQLEDAADDALARAARWDEYRAQIQTILNALRDDDKQTLVCLGDAMNALQEAEALLSIASAMEQASAPDLDTIYRSGQRPGSYGV